MHVKEIETLMQTKFYKREGEKCGKLPLTG
jgi:hypothetical protein